MADRIKGLRGMNDLLPSQVLLWQRLERTMASVVSLYGYEEIRLPLLEPTALFRRSIGDVTDIVEKEMYTFEDLNGDSISLRPEGTAGCLRACLEQGLLHNQSQKLWYCGPMFRHERPQKGRYRQFHQFGLEAFGFDGLAAELEVMLIGQRLWQGLGVDSALVLEIKTLGEPSERQVHRQRLIDHFPPHCDQLDQDSQARVQRSPLRLLDSKAPQMQALIQAAPSLMDCLGPSSRDRFEALCAGLDALGVAYRVNPSLVRGLDYYAHSVFEWVTTELGSQAAVCAGGVYNSLVEQLGGQAMPAVGMAIGLERLLLLLEACQVEPEPPRLPLVYVIHSGQPALWKALSLAEALRSTLEARILVHSGEGSFKSQFKKADKSGARFALILGEEELETGTVTIKDLRQASDQQRIPEEALSSYFSGEKRVSV